MAITDNHIWIEGTWGSDDKLTRMANALSPKDLQDAINEFYDMEGCNTIEMLTEEQQQHLYDIMDLYLTARNCDKANAIFL